MFFYCCVCVCVFLYALFKSNASPPPSFYIRTIAGTGTAGAGGNNLAATSTALDNPYGVFVSPNGILFIADTGNNLVRMQSRTNPTDLVILAGRMGSAGGKFIDNVVGTSAKFDGPRGMCMDTSGTLYVADRMNDRIRAINVTTTFTTTLVGSSSGSVDGKKDYQNIFN
jgi:sugar lactone lactonase YvrE